MVCLCVVYFFSLVYDNSETNKYLHKVIQSAVRCQNNYNKSLEMCIFIHKLKRNIILLYTILNIVQTNIYYQAYLSTFVFLFTTLKRLTQYAVFFRHSCALFLLLMFIIIFVIIIFTSLLWQDSVCFACLGFRTQCFQLRKQFFVLLLSLTWNGVESMKNACTVCTGLLK